MDGVAAFFVIFPLTVYFLISLPNLIISSYYIDKLERKIRFLLYNRSDLHKIANDFDNIESGKTPAPKNW